MIHDRAKSSFGTRFEFKSHANYCQTLKDQNFLIFIGIGIRFVSHTLPNILRASELMCCDVSPLNT